MSPATCDIRAVWTDYRRTRCVSLRNRLVLHYQRLVEYHAARVARALPPDVTAIDEEDFRAAGTIGLMDAIERYDPAAGTEFQTFASPRVHGEMVEMLRRLDPAPRQMRQRATAGARAIERLALQLEREPTDAELAAELKVAVEDVGNYRRIVPKTARITARRDDGDRSPGGVDVRGMADRRAPSPLRVAEEADGVDKILRGLSQREQIIVKLYVIEGFRMLEVGRVVGLSESAISQIIAKVKSRLMFRDDLRPWPGWRAET